MTIFSPELIALAHYLAGEFDNRTQAIADPVWYVHLRLWMRPLPFLLFPNSITLFAEQANALTLDQSYRPRFLQLYLKWSERTPVRAFGSNGETGLLNGATGFINAWGNPTASAPGKPTTLRPSEIATKQKTRKPCIIRLADRVRSAE